MNAVPLKTIPVLRVLMMVRNVSAADLARHIGVSGPYVSNWLHGKYEPSKEQALKAAEYLRTPLDDFWEEEEALPEKKVGKLKRVAEEQVIKHLVPQQPAVPEPDYSAIEAAKLRVIRSINYQGPDAIERVIAPYRLAASDPATLDPDDEGSVSVPRHEATGRQNAPLWPVRVSGESMNRIIPNGALVFVRRSSKPPQNRIVLATVQGGVTMKWLRGEKLEPDSTDQSTPIDLLEESDLIGEVVAVHLPTPK